MPTGLMLGVGGVALLILVLLIVFVLLGRRARRGRKSGRYTYRAGGQGSYDNSSTGNPH
jgi:hypothetical protein